MEITKGEQFGEEFSEDTVNFHFSGEAVDVGAWEDVEPLNGGQSFVVTRGD